jgi:ATP-dependent RNA helicase DeaD
VEKNGPRRKKGIAITFISPSEYRKLMVIQRMAKTKIRKENLPRVSDIVDIKKSRIKSEIDG